MFRKCEYIPILETKRLLLRELVPSDATDLKEWFGRGEVYALYGFQQIETPSMENLSTLMGKYGEEGDKLLFKVLNSGDFLRDIPEEDLKQGATGHLATLLCEKGLRYDLTVPFARYVVQHREELTLPLKWIN